MAEYYSLATAAEMLRLRKDQVYYWRKRLGIAIHPAPLVSGQRRDGRRRYLMAEDIAQIQAALATNIHYYQLSAS